MPRIPREELWDYGVRSWAQRSVVQAKSILDCLCAGDLMRRNLCIKPSCQRRRFTRQVRHDVAGGGTVPQLALQQRRPRDLRGRDRPYIWTSNHTSVVFLKQGQDQVVAELINILGLERGKRCLRCWSRGCLLGGLCVDVCRIQPTLNRCPPTAVCCDGLIFGIDLKIERPSGWNSFVVGRQVWLGLNPVQVDLLSRDSRLQVFEQTPPTRFQTPPLHRVLLCRQPASLTLRTTGQTKLWKTKVEYLIGAEDALVATNTDQQPRVAPTGHRLLQDQPTALCFYGRLEGAKDSMDFRVCFASPLNGVRRWFDAAPVYVCACEEYYSVRASGRDFAPIQVELTAFDPVDQVVLQGRVGPVPLPMFIDRKQIDTVHFGTALAYLLTKQFLQTVLCKAKIARQTSLAQFFQCTVESKHDWWLRRHEGQRLRA